MVARGGGAAKTRSRGGRSGDPAASASPAVEREDARTLILPGPGRVIRVLGRALRLRCPHCGSGPVMIHWLKMRERCGRCGLRIERGERDYFMGSMLFNLILAELLFAGLFVGVIVVRWPAVPWDTIEWAAPLAVAVSPLLLFPFSKLVWLAFDVALRPVTADELHPAIRDATM